MRLLVVQTAFVGDLVLTLPLVVELKRITGAQITIVTTPVGRELFAMSPAVDRTIAFDKRRGGPGALWRLAGRLRGEGFAIAVAAHRSHRSAALLRLSAIPQRIGFARAPGRWSYTRTVPLRRDEHASLRYLALSLPLGGDPARWVREPVLSPGPLARRRVDRLLGGAGLERKRPLVAIAPGSAWATKRWLPERFATLIDRIADSGRVPVLVGSDGERALCAGVSRLTACRPVDLSGRTTIGDLAALLERASLLVANDSGTGHVAAAVGTPVVSLFGPTVPAMGFSPIGSAHRIAQVDGLGCRPCSRHGTSSCPEGHFRCMREIGVDRVFRLVERASAECDQPDAARRPG